MLKPVRFIVLIPHRDISGLIRAYRNRLFAAGVTGAYSFPIAAPLALVSRPLSREELKALAHSLRELSLVEDRKGKITAKKLQSLTYLSLFGLELDLRLPDFPLDTVTYQFPSVVLCTGIINPEDRVLVYPPAPPCFFRAAMVANMILCPLTSGAEGYSFEWKIGAPVWLPKYKPCKEGQVSSRIVL